MDDDTLRALQSNYVKVTGGLQQPAQTQKSASTEKKREGWMNFIPMATSILGGIGGSFLAPGLGTAAGGAAGGALGEWLTQKLSGEKQDLGKVGVEGAFGALGGVGKGIKAIGAAGKAVRAGEGAAKATKILRYGAPAATNVAEATAKGGARGWVSDKLLKAADNTALRASQLSGKKEALKGFDKRFGEDLGTYLRKNNLIGKTGKDVEAGVIAPLNSKYGDLVGGIKRDITSSDVLANNQKELQKLIDSSSSAGNKLSDDVFKELDDIFKKNGDKISPAKLNEIKSEFQKNARNAYKLGANAKPGVDEKVAQFLKKTLQGVSGSDELAKTGQSLDKGYKAADLLASAEQNGRGTLSLGLTDLLAAGAGGIPGGVPGAVAAVGAKRAINSPKVQSFIANKLASSGEKIAGTAAPKLASTGAKQTAIDMAKAQAVPRVVGAAASADMPTDTAAPTSDLNPNSPFNPSSPNYNPNLVDPNAAGDPYSLGSVMGAQESQYSLEAMQADIMRDPDNADQYAKIYELMNPQGATADPLSATAQKQVATAQSGMDSLATLESIINEGGVPAGTVVPGRDALGGLGARVLGTASYDAAVNNVADAIIRMRTGAAATEQEMKTFRAQLPQAGDSPEVIQQKLATVRSYLQPLAQPGGGGSTTIEDLMAAQQ